ncbi:MAG: hypothetical protein WCG87_02860 [Bacteroidota bacterium]
MERFRLFFTKKLLVFCLAADIPISILFNYRYTSQRLIPFFSKASLVLFSTFLLADYLVLLAIFLVIFWLGTQRKDK